VEPPNYADWRPEPFPEPWLVLADDARPTFQDELTTEVAAGHPLGGEVVTAVAKCGHCDSAVFAVEGRFVQWALVHLTWSGRPESPPWPTASLHATLRAAMESHEMG
jgi:hypothetical protein